MIKAAVLDKWPGGITTLLAVLCILFGDAMFVKVIVGEFNFILVARYNIRLQIRYGPACEIARGNQKQWPEQCVKQL
jgi:hypothetical protein